MEKTGYITKGHSLKSNEWIIWLLLWNRATSKFCSVCLGKKQTKYMVPPKWWFFQVRWWWEITEKKTPSGAFFHGATHDINEGLCWDSQPKKKWFMSSWWWWLKILGNLSARSKLYVSAETFFHHEWNTRPSSEKHGTEFHVGWSTVPKCTILCHFKRTCIFAFRVGKIWQPRFRPILPRDVF